MLLRLVRIVIAAAVILLLTFHFLDFANILPGEINWLERIQFLPSLLGHAGVITLAILAVTLLMGRVYCSVVCPLGILQDIISRAGTWTKKRLGTKPRFNSRPAMTKTRLGILVLLLACFPILPTVIYFFDPYSIYGRITTSVFKPVWLTANNVLARLMGTFDIYTFYYVEAAVESLAAFFIALTLLVVVGVFAWRNGRTYCNTICPVGTFLGLISRFSILKVRINADKCKKCGMCAAKCKASCIDAANQKVDSSRCVDCFDCLGSCKFEALSFGFPGGTTKKNEVSSTEQGTKSSPEPGTVTGAESSNVSGAESGNVSSNVSGSGSSEFDESRRQFLTLAALATAGAAAGSCTAGTNLMAAETASEAGGTAPKIVLTGHTPFVRQVPIAPPGAISIGHLNHHCTSCHLCIAKCPAHVLKPAIFEYGPKGFLQPRMDFTRGFCNYDCTICSEVCPAGALRPLTKDQKHMNQGGRVQFIIDNCIVKVEETNCGACSEHCETQAVTMVPYKGREDLTIPEIHPDLCIGCGGCEHICPARPYRAIYIEGNEKHVQRKEIVEEVKKEIKVDDFGF